jgi:transcriptional regulator GlxA family with amidase domain
MQTIGFVIFPGFQLLDATGPLAAFEIAGRYGPGGYRLLLLSTTGGAIASSAGISLTAEPLASAPRLDSLIIAGGDGTNQARQDPVLLAYVRRAASQVRRIASVCSGAYILAEAGLLDGRRATTHWSRSADFARRYPRIRLEPDRIYVKDGAVWSSAGITAGIDLALALVAEDLGESVARRTAEQLVVYRQRPGGQSQFSALLQLERQGGRFGPLLAWAGDHLRQPLSVEQLADQAGMSPRNFARRFQQEIGLTPARAVARLRLEAARRQVEDGRDPIEVIAAAVGFHDPERMRRAFIAAFGQPPQALRRAVRRASREVKPLSPD